MENKFYLYLLHLTQIIQNVTTESGSSSLDSFLQMFDSILVNEKLPLVLTNKVEMEQSWQQIENQKRTIVCFQEKFQSVLKSVQELDVFLGGLNDNGPMVDDIK